MKGFILIVILLITLLLGGVVYTQKKSETSPSPASTIQISPSPSVDWYQPKGQFGSEEYWDSVSKTIPASGTDLITFKFPKFSLEIKYLSFLEGSYHDQDLTPKEYGNDVSQLRIKKDDKVIVVIYPGRWGTEGPTYTTKEPLYINGAQLVISGEKIDKIKGYEEKDPIKKTNSYTFTANYPESGERGGKRIWFVCSAKNTEDEAICDQIASTIRFTPN